MGLESANSNAEHALIQRPFDNPDPIVWYDGTKIEIDERSQYRLRRTNVVKWVQNGNFNNGLKRYYGRWGCWHFIGDGLRCFEMRGSFHKHYQGSNWRDFRASELQSSVGDVCHRLGVHPESLVLRNVEMGPNVDLPWMPNDLLPLLVHHKLARPVPYKKLPGVTFVHDGYNIKVYYKPEGSVFRIEVVVKNMREVKSLGIRTVADLLDPTIWDSIPTFVMVKLSHLLIIEPQMPLEGLKLTDRDLVLQAPQFEYWKQLKPAPRCRKRSRLQELYAAHEKCNTRSRLFEAIERKMRMEDETQRVMLAPRVINDWSNQEDKTDVMLTPLIVMPGSLYQFGRIEVERGK
jgi:hypothetical protein